MKVIGAQTVQSTLRWLESELGEAKRVWNSPQKASDRHAVLVFYAVKKISAKVISLKEQTCMILVPVGQVGGRGSAGESSPGLSPGRH